MNKKYLILSIGSFNIKLLNIKMSSNKFVLYNPMTFKFPEVYIENNKIVNQEALFDFIKNSLSEYPSITKQLVVILNENLTITRDVEIPNAKQIETEKMLKMEASTFLPGDISEYIIRYKKMLSNKESKKNYILMSFIKKKTSLDFYEFFKNLKYKIDSFDTPMNCLIKFFIRYLKSEYDDNYHIKTYSLINIGSNNVKFIIIQKGKLVSQHLLSYSSKMIDDLLSNYLNIDIKLAEQYKFEYGINYLYSSVTDPLSSKVGSIINPQLDILLNDLYYFIDDYNYKNKNDKISEILLSGGMSKMKGLTQYIQEAYNTPCKIINSKGSIIFSDKGLSTEYKSDDLFPIYASLIGASIRGD